MVCEFAKSPGVISYRKIVHADLDRIAGLSLFDPKGQSVRVEARRNFIYFPDEGEGEW
jgi:hypothetical protein